MLKDKTIILGVTGGIAAYKAAEIVRLLVKEGAIVRVIMTKNAQEFITPLTLQTLSGNPVSTETFSLTQESEIGHIRLADSADLILIAPATANVIAKLAHGLADDLLTTVLLATTAPILIAPAMNVHMYAHPLVQENMRKLASLGYGFVEPAEGFLACGYEGKGRLADPEDIVEETRALLTKKDLRGERIIVTAGPNAEPIDPVRFITNRSTGKMGFAMARVAWRRGADVTLVSGPTALPPPRGVRFCPVRTAQEMRQAVWEYYPQATMVISAAAVADYRPAQVAPQKIKKKGEGNFTIELTRNPDILAELGQQKGHCLLVGFATETEEILPNAVRKLRSKNLDMIVANDVTQEGAGFAHDTNIVTLIDRSERIETLPLMSKDEVAHTVYDRLLALKNGAAVSNQ
ncbi:MAG TPA: bifunctional phosphopantothenoylcysteine decarboxylase/phosphopantothenate--cysteine ligase CoaBC [Candidatus Binatia bacterium]|jgi:phosphopantothenoylcysteine decarboxylase/phosphopantothenate--cysteine ligase|nr:bifunctional phosphopantothenoylcysteine decarboxylase/phosphopantothenate--cysteine ligase CoaBC [Candidatus Binatia bacterium]